MIVPPTNNVRMLLVPDSIADVVEIPLAVVPDMSYVGEYHKPVRLVKLARSGMRSHVVRLLNKQGGLCPLCRKPIDLTEKGEGVLDHDHDTGRIRGVLHRSCNAAEGKISNAAARWGAKSSRYVDIIAYLKNLTEYLEAEATTMIYPMHKTPDEKKDAALAKKRERAADIRAKKQLAQLKRKGSNDS